MGLTCEQQQVIENTQWIVNTVLKKYGASFDNDLRQSALLYMCECMLRYNPRLGKWETYAYTNIRHFVLRSLSKKTSEQSCLIYCGDNLQEEEEFKNDEVVETNAQIIAIKTVCTERERDVIDLLLLGYRKGEIAKKIRRSPATVSGIIKAIREKNKGEAGRLLRVEE